MAKLQRDCSPAPKADKGRAKATAKVLLRAAKPPPARTPAKQSRVKERGDQGPPVLALAPPTQCLSVVPIPMLPHEVAIARQTWPGDDRKRSAEPSREIPYAIPPPAARKKKKALRPPIGARTPAPKRNRKSSTTPRARKMPTARELIVAPLPNLSPPRHRPLVLFRPEQSRPLIKRIVAKLRGLARWLKCTTVRRSPDRRLLAQANRRYRQLLQQAETALLPILPSA